MDQELYEPIFRNTSLESAYKSIYESNGISNGANQVGRFVEHLVEAKFNESVSQRELTRLLVLTLNAVKSSDIDPQDIDPTTFPSRLEVLIWLIVYYKDLFLDSQTGELMSHIDNQIIKGVVESDLVYALFNRGLEIIEAESPFSADSLVGDTKPEKDSNWLIASGKLRIIDGLASRMRGN